MKCSPYGVLIIYIYLFEKLKIQTISVLVPKTPNAEDMYYLRTYQIVYTLTSQTSGQIQRHSKQVRFGQIGYIRVGSIRLGYIRLGYWPPEICGL